VSKDGEYTILKRKYLERGKRIAELEATIKRVELAMYREEAVFDTVLRRIREALGEAK